MGIANLVKEEVLHVVCLLLEGRNAVRAQELFSLAVAHEGLAFESVEGD
jgi:hypothetical protein